MIKSNRLGLRKLRNVFLFCVLLSTLACKDEKSYQFKLLQDNNSVVAEPISVSLNGLSVDGMALFNEGRHVSYQIDSLTKKLYFLHSPASSKIYTFKNKVSDSGNNQSLVSKKKNGNLQLSIDDKPVVQYRYKMMKAPNGVDSMYQKSGYIHPILTPKGDTLSRIQPPDHYHHYGMWGPWTHTQIDGQQVDFWNLGDHKGTVLFKAFNTITSGAVFSGFNAKQEHIDLLTQKKPQVALRENLAIRVWDLNRPDRYMFDYTSSFTTPLEGGITFEAYRYGGGIGMRFTERWHADNCTVLTSEGEDRLTADGTSARWCIVSGESADKKGESGILFMSYPENKAHPEPMRVWPIDANNGSGDMFFEFCPIRYDEWKIKPKTEYNLKYRMVVFDGQLSAEEAEAYWQTFAKLQKVEIIKSE